MATIVSDSYPTKLNFIDSPIVMGVTSFSFPSDAVFKQVVIEVEVTPTYSGATASTYTFAVDTQGQDTVWIDISSALRAAMNSWHPTPDLIVVEENLTFSFDNPYATFTSKVWERYLLEGEVWTGDAVSREMAYAYYGGVTEYERMAIQKHPAEYIGLYRNLSRKPQGGELYGSGDFQTMSALLPENDGLFFSTYGQLRATGNLKKGQYRHFLFINSFGVLESCSAPMLESLSYSFESERKSLVSAPSFFSNPNQTTTKTAERAIYKMSSGYVNRAWADWWTCEFLKARYYWVRMYDTLWMPCTVTPADDETLIYNRADQQLPHVDFDVELAVSGSIRSPFIDGGGSEQAVLVSQVAQNTADIAALQEQHVVLTEDQYVNLDEIDTEKIYMVTGEEEEA